MNHKLLLLCCALIAVFEAAVKKGMLRHSLARASAALTAHGLPAGFHASALSATTVLCVRKGDQARAVLSLCCPPTRTPRAQVVMIGDGQVTQGAEVVKAREPGSATT